MAYIAITVTLLTMTPLMNVLLFLVVCLMTGVYVGANSLDKRASSANNTDEDNYMYYNIYTKIGALEKDLKKLETRLQKKKKLLRQVLQSVIDIDSNLGLADNSLKKHRQQTSKKNGNLLFKRFSKLNSPNLYYF